MTTTILVIDDNEVDQHLFRRAFKDFDCFRLEMVSSAEAGFARISDTKPDLILLDYNLPDMDGLSFIKRMSAYSDTPIPIIMLTGESNVTVAVEAMKNGVDDYIVKDTEGQYLRLLPGVSAHVMAAHAQRELTNELQLKTKALFRRNQTLMQNAMDGIHVMDMQGNIVEANDAFCQMLGYSQEEMAYLNVADWDAQWSAEELQERFRWLIGKSTRFETCHRRKDGTFIDVEVSTSGVKIEEKYFLFAASRDITERKQRQLESEALLQRNLALMKSSMDGIHVLDIQGNLVDFNDAFGYMLGYSREEMAGLNVSDWSAEFSSEASRVRFSEYLGKNVMLETLCRRKDGTLINVEISIAREEIDGKILLFCSSRDITERKIAEKKILLESKAEHKRAEVLAQQFGHLLKSSFNEIYLFDADSLHFLETSEGAVKNLGYSADELAQLTPLDLKPSYARDSFEELIAPLRRGQQQSLLFETLHRRKDGTTYPVEVRLQLMGEDFPVFLAIVQDITERSRAESQLREFSAHLQAVREEEKASLAREVHDELGGTLAALKMDAHWLSRKLATEHNMLPLQECALSMVGLLDSAVIATRRIITELRPTLLDDLGLLDALKWQSAQFQKRTGIECRVDYVDDENIENTLDKTQLINLFRIFQETLTNVARHSGASRVGVELHQDDEEVVLSISDNGCGLPEGHIFASTSYGIRGMRERVVQLGGKLKLGTPPGGGFSVTVAVPVQTLNTEKA